MKTSRLFAIAACTLGFTAFFTDWENPEPVKLALYLAIGANIGFYFNRRHKNGDAADLTSDIAGFLSRYPDAASERRLVNAIRIGMTPHKLTGYVPLFDRETATLKRINFAVADFVNSNPNSKTELQQIFAHGRHIACLKRGGLAHATQAFQNPLSLT